MNTNHIRKFWLKKPLKRALLGILSSAQPYENVFANANVVGRQKQYGEGNLISYRTETNFRGLP